jgi:peptide/nickel transport system permease protein
MLFLLSAVIRRLAAAIPTLLIVSMLVFSILRLLPTDPISMLLPMNATQDDIARIRHALGFDRSITVQYVVWLSDFLHGNLGLSIQSREPVAALIQHGLPTTLELVFCSLVVGTALGLAFGLLNFHWRGSAFDHVGEVTGSLLLAVPDFLWGILLMLTLGIGLQWLPFIGPVDPAIHIRPVTGFLLVDALISFRLDAIASVLGHLAIPVVALAMAIIPLIMRVLRASLAEAYAEEYIHSARLRGIDEFRILFGQALKNAILPTISIIGVQAGMMFGSTLLIETIFGLPGLGNLMVVAVRATDLPLIQDIAMTYCIIVMVINTSVDVVSSWLDPRLRLA